VHGIKRRASSFNTTRIDHLYQDPHESNPSLTLHYGDLTDSTNLRNLWATGVFAPAETSNAAFRPDLPLRARLGGSICSFSAVFG
jgi:GDP-D-mannose dehydratase